MRCTCHCLHTLQTDGEFDARRGALHSQRQSAALACWFAMCCVIYRVIHIGKPCTFLIFICLFFDCGVSTDIFIFVTLGQSVLIKIFLTGLCSICATIVCIRPYIIGDGVWPRPMTESDCELKRTPAPFTRYRGYANWNIVTFNNIHVRTYQSLDV